MSRANMKECIVYADPRCASAQERIFVLHRSLGESHFNSMTASMVKFVEEFYRVSLLRMLDLVPSGCIGEIPMMLMLPITPYVSSK